MVVDFGIIMEFLDIVVLFLFGYVIFYVIIGLNGFVEVGVVDCYEVDEFGFSVLYVCVDCVGGLCYVFDE